MKQHIFLLFLFCAFVNFSKPIIAWKNLNQNHTCIDLEKEVFGEEEEKQENKDKSSDNLACSKSTNVDLAKSSSSISSIAKKFHCDTTLSSYLHQKYLDSPPELFLA